MSSRRFDVSVSLRSVQYVMCERAGLRPVMIDVRVGVQTGADAYACVKVIPRAASRS